MGDIRSMGRVIDAYIGGGEMERCMGGGEAREMHMCREHQ